MRKRNNSTSATVNRFSNGRRVAAIVDNVNAIGCNCNYSVYDRFIFQFRKCKLKITVISILIKILV